MIRREPYKGEVTLHGGHRRPLPSMDLCLRLPHQGDRYPTDHHFGTTHKQTDPQPNHPKSLQIITLVSYFDKRIKLSAHQQSILSLDPVQCSISRNDRHVQVVFLGSRNPGKVEGDQQCGRTGSSETMASLPVVCLQYNCTKCISPKSYNTFVQMVPVEQWSPSLTTRCLLAVSPYNC